MNHSQKSAPPAGERPVAPGTNAPPGLALTVLPGKLGICRLHPKSRIPRWVHRSSLYSISRTADEMSIVCDEELVPPQVKCERGWRAIRVLGPLAFSLVGVLESLARPLTRAKVSIFSLSTYDTDYLLVRESKLERAKAALEAAGHRFDAAPKLPAVEPPPEAEAEEAAEPEAEEVAEPEAEEIEEIEAAPPAPVDVEPPPAPEPTAAEPAKEAREELPFPDEEAGGDDEVYDDDEEDESYEARYNSEEGADARGLFSGAIPQAPIELTDKSFEDLGLSAEILKTVRAAGFTHPTPIQAAVIPHALVGADVIGLAETGSGKTAAFALPLAERLTHGKGIRGLILCPTREIALQTKSFLDIFGRDHSLDTVSVIGGVGMRPQIEGLRRKPDIIVATPGRLADHLRRGNVSLQHMEELVLDEADHMLDLGFLPQIREILEQAPNKRRTMMFSATMPAPIERLAQLFMRDPIRVDIRPSGQVASGIEHRLYLVKEEDMKRCLVRLLEEVEGSTLIFVRRKLYTEWLARQLEIEGLPVARIHSDRSQSQRVRALRGFREGKFRILVATDVAARGLDIPRIQHVVNYGLPEATEDYVHRAGRTARGNAVGIVSSIGTWQDKVMVREIERSLNVKLPRCTVAGVEPYVELQQRKTVRRRRLL